MDSKQILAVGSIAYDTIHTSKGNAEHLLGGSATFFSLSASFYTKVSLIGVVGTDFSEDSWNILKKFDLDLSSVEIEKGQTFSWGGKYNQDYSHRETLFTNLGVFENFKPTIKTKYNQPILYLGNIQPELQFDVINKVKSPYLIAADTMNLWIDLFPDDVWNLISKVNIFFINDEEARQLTGENNLLKISDIFLNKGSEMVIIKKGSQGSLLATKEYKYNFSVVPNIDVCDPTGAGDSFAGGVLGYIAHFGLKNAIEAVKHGTAVASYSVSDFGIKNLINLTNEKIQSKKILVKSTQITKF